MAQFSYTARSGTGETRRGVLDAASLTAARKSLRDQGLFALTLAAARESAIPGVLSAPRGRKRRITTRDLLMLTSQLAVMCRSGVDLAEALRSVTLNCQQPALREVLNAVYRDVSEGQSASAALNKHADVFGQAYVASLAAGEATGNMADVLSRMRELLHHQAKLRSTVRNTLAYPVVLLGLSAVVISAVIFFVLPQFAGVFETLEIQPPASTQFLLDISCEVRSRGWLWFGLAAIIGGGLAHFLRSEGGKRWRDQMLLNLAGTREVARLLLTGRTFRLIGAMLQNGVPLLETLSLSRTGIGNRCFADLLDQLQRDVIAGRGIGQSLAASRYIPGGAAEMVMTGERTGSLGSVMEIVGQFYEEDGEERLREAAKMLEPLIIIVMGAVVAYIVPSVMLPMFEFSQGQ